MKTTFRELLATINREKRKRAYYSARCPWWTTNPKDLGERGGLPCCPYCGGMLFEADADHFIAGAEANPGHYGPGGLDTFAAAHHGSGLHGEKWDDLKPSVVRFQRRQRVLSTEKSIRCVRCRSEFSEAETEGANGCPSCGSTGVPMALKDDVTIRINWHELRILGIWADNWAGVCDKNDPEKDAKGAVTGILRSIQSQHPDRTPLTILGELKQVQEQYPEMTATDHFGETIIKPKKPN